MPLRFSTSPGRRERHLQRRHLNPLFGDPAPAFDRSDLDTARRADQAEARAFQDQFAALIQDAARLDPNADSDSVLGLKERLEQAYEQACALGGNLEQPKKAIRHLVDVIGRAVRRAAGDDPRALDELNQEDTARELHYRLLEHDLVADLLAPDSPIGPDELMPTLLACEAPAFLAAMELFDARQMEALLRDGQALLDRRGGSLPDRDAHQARLAVVERRLGAGGRADN